MDADGNTRCRYYAAHCLADYCEGLRVTELGEKDIQDFVNNLDVQKDGLQRKIRYCNSLCHVCFGY